MRVLLAHAGLAAGALLLLGLGACGAPHNADLFRASGTLGESGNGGAGNSSGAAAYPSAGSIASGSGSNAGRPEGSAGNAEQTGGQSSAPPDGGAGSGGAASGLSGSANGGSGGAPHAGGTGKLGDCSQFGDDVSYFPDTQHCYRVVQAPANFAAAEAYCKTLGAHLITLASAAENDFAWSLNSEEHWIGAEDGKGPSSPDEGTFRWVSDEPFSYTNWSSNQPNTSDTNCGDSGLTGHCYEHCAFQWTGGEHDGQWNDRFCLHTIASICEFDSAK